MRTDPTQPIRRLPFVPYRSRREQLTELVVWLGALGTVALLVGAGIWAMTQF